MTSRTVIKLGATLAATLAFGYVALCAYLLDSLDSEFLIQMRVLEYSSASEPVGLPMPGAFKDMYWECRGSGRVLNEAAENAELAAFAVALVQHMESTGETVHRQRTADLLHDLAAGDGGG